MTARPESPNQSSNPGERSSFRKNRQEFIVGRLCIGRAYETHGCHPGGEDLPMCPRCYVTLTVGHILLNCLHFNT